MMRMEKTGFFAGIDDETFKRFEEEMTERSFKRGQVIFTAGSYDDRLYVVVAGVVKICRFTSDGQSRISGLAAGGDVFGEMVLFTPQPMEETAIAASNCIVASLDAAIVRKRIYSDPQLLLRFSMLLSDRVRRADSFADGLLFGSVAGRLARVLVNLADRFGHQVRDGLLVRHGLSQVELGQLCGSARETVNKVLADFRCRGWIGLESRGISWSGIFRL